MLRSFYFEHEDRRCLEEWSTSLIKDRFNFVREERDAYQQMQHEMTGILDTASKVKKSSLQEKEAIEREWMQSMKSNVDALSTFQDMLVILGVSKDHINRL